MKQNIIQQQTKNLVGVDTHKETIACYVNGRFKEFKTNLKGFEDAVKWAPNSKWAIEGAYCFGQPFSVYLIKNGYEVYEVNPLLTKNWRGALSVVQPKNDFGDAKVISMFAREENLKKVSFGLLKLKELLQTREFMVNERVRVINNLKMLFLTRGEKTPFNDFTTKKGLSFLESHSDLILRQQGALLKQIIQNIKEYETEIENNMPEKAKKLLSIKGIGKLRAAQIVVETKGEAIKESSLANYAGIAPVEKSSGKTQRFKTNKKGNRKLNSIFYSLSIAQVRYNEEAKKYYEKKLKEGKTKRHARKCVARQLVRIVSKLLRS